MNYAKESNGCSEELNNSSKESTNLRASLFTLPPLWSLQTISVLSIHSCRHRGIAELILSSVPFLPLMGFTMRQQFPVSPKRHCGAVRLGAPGSRFIELLFHCVRPMLWLMHLSNVSCNNQNSPIQYKPFWILAPFWCHTERRYLSLVRDNNWSQPCRRL